MEMPLAGPDVDHVARFQHVAGVSLRTDAPSTAHPEEELPPRMLMPVGPGVRDEVHHADVRPVLCREGRAEPHLAREPGIGAAFERAL